ncbi:hypothetical protein [Bacillus litorisediminis]|uniref:hypothetical protein n=1 Tax=Bacillus litorisediminis TaxID=2922713 RepID=UPI001FAEE04E|nr:hypothetical protein [Bacillus litorisediminis]
MLRRIFSSFAILLILLTIFPAQKTWANQQIQLDVQAGIDGMVKMGMPFPLTVEIVNNGDDFVGEISVLFRPSYNSGGSLLIPVNLPANATKTITVTHPGVEEAFLSNNQQATIQLFEGKAKDGKEVDFGGDQNFRPRLLQADQSVISVVTSNPDMVNPYKTVSNSPISPFVFDMEEKDFPEDYYSLSMIDLVVLDDAHMDEWTEKQQEALIQYIKTGGTVLLSNQTEQVSHLGALKEYVPFQNSDAIELEAVTFIQDEQPSLQNITLYSGDIADDSQAVVKDQNITILAKNQVVMGNIFQTAFPIDHSEITQHPNFDEFITANLMSRTTNFMNNQYGPNFVERLYYEFGEAAEYVENNHYSVGFIALLFGIYVFVFIPGLYFLLKKRDKREHTWWVIPVISLAASAAIFSMGAWDRIGKPTVNEAGIYVLDGQENAVGYTSVALMSNKQGAFSLSFSDPGFRPVPVMRESHEFNSTDLQEAFVQLNTPKKEIHFPSVEFWSTRTMLGSMIKENIGSLAAELKYENERLVGTVTNHLNVPIEDLKLITGSETVDIGKIEAGESISIDKKIGNTVLTGPNFYQRGAIHVGHPYQPNRDIKEIQRDVLYNFSTNTVIPKLENQPILLGYSDRPFVVVGLGQGSKRNATNLFIQPISIETVYSGSIELTQKEMIPEFKSIDSLGGIFEQNENEIFVEPGQYQYTLQVPPKLMEQTPNFTELGIRFYTSPATETYLYNVKLKEYKKIEESEQQLSFTEDIHDYLDEQGQLIFKFVKGQQDPRIQFPRISLKGEIQP